ncbi:MAG TPA: hypothetical protein VG943_01645 [Caulobacterales bacterium]|nr:hypothetical protein [Caulobacterales bacterium]
MDAARFEAIVAAYGADAARWPEAERAAAQAFAQTSSEAQAILAEAHALDALLAADADEAPVSVTLTRRLMRTIPSPSPQRVWGVAAALAACAVLGVVVGYNSPQGDDPAMTALGAAFGEGFEG